MVNDVLVSCSSLIKGVWLSKLSDNIAIVEQLAELYHYNGVILVIPPSSQQEASAILKRQQSLFMTVILYKRDNHFLLKLREKEAVFVFLEDSETKQFLLQSLKSDTKVFSVSSWFIFTESKKNIVTFAEEHCRFDSHFNIILPSSENSFDIVEMYAIKTIKHNELLVRSYGEFTRELFSMASCDVDQPNNGPNKRPTCRL